MEIPLDFLEEGASYKARVYFDDQSVQTRTKVGIRELDVDSGSVMKVVMGVNGGQAVRIAPEK